MLTFCSETRVKLRPGQVPTDSRSVPTPTLLLNLITHLRFGWEDRCISLDDRQDPRQPAQAKPISPPRCRHHERSGRDYRRQVRRGERAQGVRRYVILPPMHFCVSNDRVCLLVSALPPSEIVDTNGAGDMFAGGYLGAVVLGKSTDEAVEIGHKLGAMCVGQVCASS